MEENQISARMADQLLYLPPAQQRAELERRLSALTEREERSRTAAEAIRSYLNTHDRIDLQDLEGRIRQALATAL
jgi:hypothetical protein